MSSQVFRSAYTAAQIEASIGKTPRINAGNRTWEIWDIATGAYVDTGVSIDTELFVDSTLTEAGYAADAKVTGDKISDLKSALENAVNGSEIEMIDSPAFEQGSINSSYGSNVVSSTRIRSVYFKVGNIARFVAESGYKFMVYLYTTASYSDYVGTYNGKTISKDAKWLTGGLYLGNIDTNYYCKIVFAYENDAEIGVSAAENIKTWLYTDKNLGSDGVPADAKETGKKLTELQKSSVYGGMPLIKSTVNVVRYYASSGAWVSGNYSAMIPVSAGDTIDIIAGDHSNTIAFLRSFDPSQPVDYSEAEGWTTSITISAGAGMAMTAPSDAAYLYIRLGGAQTWLPERLTINGYDYAHSIFDNIAGLNEYNTYLLKSYAGFNKEETTTNGITYSITNGILHVSGTATANAFIRLEGDTDRFPAWVRPGLCYARITKDHDDMTKYQLRGYTDATTSTPFCSTAESIVVEIPDLNNYAGVISRFYVPKGETVDNTVQVEILSAVPNIDITQNASVSAPTKLRIMQYNIGKFNMGDGLTEEGYGQFITDENYNTVLNNYKCILGDVQADIIGIEEFEDEMGVPGIGMVSFNDVLFDGLYPQGYDDSQVEIISHKAVKVKHGFQKASRKTITTAYTYIDPVSGETTASITTHPIYGHTKVDGKKIGFVVDAFPVTDAEDTAEKAAAKKKAAYSAAVDLLADDEIAFIICDANASPAIDGGTLDEIINEILTPAGYASAMGSYFPYQHTYKSEDTLEEKTLDNIFYKTDRILLSNFTVLWDEWSNLASDHVPVYADFLII